MTALASLELLRRPADRWRFSPAGELDARRRALDEQIERAADGGHPVKDVARAAQLSVDIVLRRMRPDRPTMLREALPDLDRAVLYDPTDAARFAPS